MKLEFDFEEKIVTVGEQVEIGALVKILRKLLGKEFKQWHIAAKPGEPIVTYPWTNPYPPYLYHSDDTGSPVITPTWTSSDTLTNNC